MHCAAGGLVLVLLFINDVEDDLVNIKDYTRAVESTIQKERYCGAARHQDTEREKKALDSRVDGPSKCNTTELCPTAGTQNLLTRKMAKYTHFVWYM